MKCDSVVFNYAEYSRCINNFINILFYKYADRFSRLLFSLNIWRIFKVHDVHHKYPEKIPLLIEQFTVTEPRIEVEH